MLVFTLGKCKLYFTHPDIWLPHYDVTLFPPFTTIFVWPRCYKTWVHSQIQNKAQAANHCALFWVWEWTQVLKPWGLISQLLITFVACISKDFLNPNHVNPSVDPIKRHQSWQFLKATACNCDRDICWCLKLLFFFCCCQVFSDLYIHVS